MKKSRLLSALLLLALLAGLLTTGASAEEAAEPTDGGSGSASASAENYYAIYHPQEGKLTVRNCNIEGRGGIQMCAGELVIEAGANIYAQDIGTHGTIDGSDGAIIDGAAVSLVKRSGYGDGSGPSVRIEGDENAALTPKADTTRAQAAAMLMRFIEL